MSLQILNVSADSTHHAALLEKAYHDIYVPAFPDPDEREDLEKFRKVLEGGIKGVGIAINILGENLDDPQKAVIKGVSVGYYYEHQNVGLLAYNAIAPEHREKGLGKILVQSRIDSLKELAAAQGKKLAGVFIEINDPQKVSPENDSMPPAVREQIFTNWGAKHIPVDYAQPPLTKDGVYCDYLKLMNYPVDGHYANKSAIEGFLRGIYREFRSPIMPEQDAHFRHMQNQLHELEAKDLPDPDAKVVPGYTKDVPPYKPMGFK